MGAVFRGYDRSLDRAVAVKVLRPELATARGAERFMHEARTLAQLSHPNVVPVHQAGEESGLYYFIMDFLEGETLRDRLEQGPRHAEGARQVRLDHPRPGLVAHPEEEDVLGHPGVVHEHVHAALGEHRRQPGLDRGGVRDVERRHGRGETLRLQLGQ